MTKLQTDAVRLSSGDGPYRLNRSVSQQQFSKHRDSTYTFTSVEGNEIRQEYYNDLKLEYARDIEAASGSCSPQTCAKLSGNTKIKIKKSIVQIGDIYITGSNNNTPDESFTGFPWPPELQVSSSKNKKKKKILLSIVIATIVIGLFIVFQVYLKNYGSSEYNDSAEKFVPSTRLETVIATTLSSETIKLITNEKLETDSIDIKSSGIKLNRKVRRIIIAQTSGPSCLTNCSEKVNKILLEDSHHRNISHNYLIDEDGSIYEERGHRFEDDQSSTIDGSSFNDIGICVAFIGSFHNSTPSDNQLAAYKMFIKQFVKDGIINKEQNVFIQDQLMENPSKAWELNRIVEDFDNFHKG